MIRRPRPSLLKRFVLAGTAVVTVWCLGCSAFDLVILQFAGASSVVMRCGGDERNSTPDAALDESGSSESRLLAVPDRENATQAVLCGCASCTAPSPAPAVTAISASALPRLLAAHSATPSSRETEPLVPPPQVTL